MEEEYWDNYGQGMGKMESYCDSVAAVMKPYFMYLAGNEEKKETLMNAIKVSDNSLEVIP